MCVCSFGLLHAHYLSSSTQKNFKMISQQQMLCGDEVQAVIADIGGAVCKFGTAGQDVPRHVFRSEIGVFIDDESRTNYVYGNNGFRFLQSGMEITRTDTNSDQLLSLGETWWDNYQKLLRHGVESCLKVAIDEYPVMLAQNYAVNSSADKLKIMEICLESEAFPAIYIASSGSLSSFSTGRRCSLVVDFGATATSITPVVDGYQMSKACIQTKRGGNLVDILLRREVEMLTGAKLRPWYECGMSAPRSNCTMTPSFCEFHINDIVRDMKHTLCHVPPKCGGGPNEIDPHKALPLSYELPDGTAVYASSSLCTVPERLFFGANMGESGESWQQGIKRSRVDLNVTMNGGSHVACGVISAQCRPEEDAISSLIYASVAQCDVDARKELLGNLMFTGGGALMDGMAQRIVHELNLIVPSHLKVKAIPSLPIERQNAAWIGGSVLSICGSFQQLWLSRSEYEEEGGLRACRRFEH